MTQEEVARATGLSRSAYIALESGRDTNPRVRQLTNCALVLGVEPKELVEELFEPEWLEWTPFDRSDAPEPPTDPSSLWRDLS